MDYKRLELKLRRIVEKRLVEGWYLAPGTYYTTTGACCAVGTVAAEMARFDEDGYFSAGMDAAHAFEREFNMKSGLGSLISGFDGAFSFEATTDKKLYAIGARIRRIYCDDNGQVE